MYSLQYNRLIKGTFRTGTQQDPHLSIVYDNNIARDASLWPVPCHLPLSFLFLQVTVCCCWLCGLLSLPPVPAPALCRVSTSL
mmetsp:Transcript_21321/g.49194  ORF Transcript_21321/g.49194 Transcript_21321/m.49194 type:complete len:83 (+) Transcript_21321:244-492(+)